MTSIHSRSSIPLALAGLPTTPRDDFSSPLEGARPNELAKRSATRTSGLRPESNHSFPPRATRSATDLPLDNSMNCAVVALDSRRVTTTSRFGLPRVRMSRSRLRDPARFRPVPRATAGGSASTGSFPVALALAAMITWSNPSRNACTHATHTLFNSAIANIAGESAAVPLA